MGRAPARILGEPDNRKQQVLQKGRERTRRWREKKRIADMKEEGQLEPLSQQRQQMTEEERREREKLLGRERARRFRERQRKAQEINHSESPIDSRLQRRRELGRERTRRWRDKKRTQEENRALLAEQGAIHGLGDDVPLTRVVAPPSVSVPMVPMAGRGSQERLPSLVHDVVADHSLEAVSHDHHAEDHHHDHHHHHHHHHHHPQEEHHHREDAEAEHHHHQHHHHHSSVMEMVSGDGERVDEDVSRENFSLLHELLMVPPGMDGPTRG